MVEVNDKYEHKTAFELYDIIDIFSILLKGLNLLKGMDDKATVRFLFIHNAYNFEIILNYLSCILLKCRFLLRKMYVTLFFKHGAEISNNNRNKN